MQALWPGLLILLAVLCFNFLGDGLRDALGPRMTLGANENYPRQPWRQPGVVLGCEQDSGPRKQYRLGAKHRREAARPCLRPTPAPGYAQANLVILPRADAFDFLRFAQRNPKPCPIVEVRETGDRSPS